MSVLDGLREFKGRSRGFHGFRGIPEGIGGASFY